LSPSHPMSIAVLDATTDTYTLSLHDALPIFRRTDPPQHPALTGSGAGRGGLGGVRVPQRPVGAVGLGTVQTAHDSRRSRLRHHRSEEHTSELQSRENLVCRLLLEKKKKS